MYQSSTSIYKQNFAEIGETFCGQMDGHIDGQMGTEMALLG